MKLNALRQEGYELLHQGCISLAQVEGNGIRIDMDRLAQTKEELAGKIKTLKSEIQETEVWKLWRRRFGDKAKLSSREQMGVIFYKELDRG